MKKLLLAIIALPLVLCSCQKQTKEQETVVNETDWVLQFTLTNVAESVSINGTKYTIGENYIGKLMFYTKEIKHAMLAYYGGSYCTAIGKLEVYQFRDSSKYEYCLYAGGNWNYEIKIA